MFIRVMVIVGAGILVLAYIMFSRAPRPVPSPLPATPVGTSTLSHGGPPVAPPSHGLPDRPGDGGRNLGHPGDAQ